MRPYIYGSVNGIHVINLLETAKKLDEVKAELKDGVLTISFEKEKTEAPIRIPIA